jgi:hypothetical protein
MFQEGCASLMIGTPTGRLTLSVTENGSGTEPGDACRRLLDEVFC